jgi:3-dehydroquinate synthase
MDNRTLRVGLGDRAYDIIISGGAIKDAGTLLRDIPADGAVRVISDSNVYGLYGETLARSLSGAGTESDSFIIPPGEASTNIDTLSRIYDWFTEGGRLTRDGLIIALGGGVVGDIAGFAAATWMRGVRFVQIPTTLLAMVDSSVGGKTAVDTERGKNLVGAFHQPSRVIIDPKLTESLPEREMGAGMAEVIKYGAIASEELLARLERDGADADRADVIRECCSIKARIVEDDEFDRGGRAVLNFGHTFGHAIEMKYGFERYTPGEAVAAGMRIAAAVGVKLGVTDADVPARLDSALKRAGLLFDEPADNLLGYMKNDKKSVSGGVNLVLLRRVGEAVVRRVTWSELEGLTRE